MCIFVLHNGIFNKKIKTMKSLLTILLLFPFLFVFGQKENHANCETAQEVFDKKTIVVEKMSEDGLAKEKIDELKCFKNGLQPDYIVNNVYWFTWECIKKGNLGFEISPLEEADDIDFVVFSSTYDTNLCNGKKVLRCMAAGYYEISSPCMGVTGLKVGELDKSKDSGCKDDETNFLRELNMQVGETYFLCVINVSSKSGFSIKFNGDGLIGNENPKK